MTDIYVRSFFRNITIERYKTNNFKIVYYVGAMKSYELCDWQLVTETFLTFDVAKS